MNWYGALKDDRTGSKYDIISSRTRLSRARIKAKFGKKEGGRGYIVVFGPFPSIHSVTTIVNKAKGTIVGFHQYPPANPPQHISTDGAIEIYDRVQAIEARKGKRSLWPDGDFRHDFTRKGAKVFGLQNGNLLVVGKVPLWKMFKYPTKDVSGFE